MHTAYLFSTSHGERVDDWQLALTDLTSGNVLWIDMQSPLEEEQSAVREALWIERGHDRPRLRRTGARS